MIYICGFLLRVTWCSVSTAVQRSRATCHWAMDAWTTQHWLSWSVIWRVWVRAHIFTWSWPWTWSRRDTWSWRAPASRWGEALLSCPNIRAQFALRNDRVGVPWCSPWSQTTMTCPNTPQVSGVKMIILLPIANEKEQTEKQQQRNVVHLNSACLLQLFYHPLSQNFTHISFSFVIIVELNTSQNSQLMMLSFIFVLLLMSHMITRVCQISCQCNCHFRIVTKNGRCVVSCLTINFCLLYSC